MGEDPRVDILAEWLAESPWDRMTELFQDAHRAAAREALAKIDAARPTSPAPEHGVGDCGECGMPAQLVTCVHDDLSGDDCPGSLGGAAWAPSALGVAAEHATPAGYVVAGYQHGRLVADWDGEVHETRGRGEEEVLACRRAGYSDWQLYELRPVGAASPAPAAPDRSLAEWLDEQIANAAGARREVEEDFPGSERPNDADLAYAREKAFREVRDRITDDGAKEATTTT